MDALSSSPAEMPLLMTAYEDSYHSYAASLADVDARLADLSARETAIKNRMDNARQSFKTLEAEMQQQQEVFEHHQRRSRERQLEVQEKLMALHRRREHLATYVVQRQSLQAEDEAVAAQETYWQELWKRHQHALEALTRQRGTPSPSMRGASPISRSTPSPPPAGHSPSTSTYKRIVPHPPPKPSQPQPQPPLQRAESTASPSPSPLLERWSDALSAVQSGHAAALASALRACPDAVHSTDAHGDTLLHIACAVEPPSATVLRCLLHHAAPLNVFNAAGLTPFHVACLNQQDITHAMTDALLAAGVPVDQPSQYGETAAHLLASHDAFLATLEHLIDHHRLDVASPALVAGQLRTPLEVAEFYGEAQTAGVRALLRVVA